MVAMADPVDLEFLDRFLVSDNAPENGMGLSDPKTCANFVRFAPVP